MKTKYLPFLTLMIASSALASSIRCQVNNYGQAIVVTSAPDEYSTTETTYVYGEGSESVTGTQSFDQHYLRIGCVQSWQSHAQFANFGLQLDAHNQSFDNDECGGGMPSHFEAQLTQTFLDGHTLEKAVSCTQI